jgi:hypothetical protein
MVLLRTILRNNSNGWGKDCLVKISSNNSDETGLIISICHFPPGTSKWNKIEHRKKDDLFRFQNVFKTTRDSGSQGSFEYLDPLLENDRENHIKFLIMIYG